MDPLYKIKIYNKYAEYPKISQFDSSYFKKKAKTSDTLYLRLRWDNINVEIPIN